MKYEIKKLDAFLHDYMIEKKIPGMTVCISSPEGLIYSKAFGHRDMEKTKPVDENTIFGIASMTKSVTCICLAILESEGKLSFQDPICKYFPEFKIPGTPREAVLIHHLCNMTSGLPALPTLMMSIATNSKLGPWIGEEAQTLIKRLRPNSFANIDEIIEYITDSEAFEPLGAPGEYINYSNDGYAILSSIVDIASGSTLEQFAYERIFKPLGMTCTTFDIDEAKATGNITSLFTVENEQLYCTDDWLVAPPYRGTGFLKSTSVDMCKYYETLACDGIYRGKHILPEGTVSRILGRAFPETEESAYCYGINKRIFRDMIICEHGGSLPGISSKGGFIKEKGLAATILMNIDDVDVNIPLNTIWNIMLGLPYDTVHMPVQPADILKEQGRSPENPEAYTGTYSTNEFFPQKETKVFLDADGKLRAATDKDEYEMLFLDTTRFLLLDENKPLDQCTRIKFLVRNDKSWAIQEGNRLIPRM